MLQKFSFARVSAGAVALATLCPLPSQALTFRFQFSDGTNIGTGEIQGTDTGQTYTDAKGTQSIYQATGGFINFVSGSQSYSGTYNFKDLSSLSAVNISTWPSVYNPYYKYPANPSGEFWNNKFNNSYLWQDFYPGVVFANGDDSKVAGLWSNGSSQMLALYDTTATLSPWTYYPLTTFSPSTPVPAPLPLLGLGAATAFSRKLKQRIALRRTREKVGAAM